MGLLADDDRRRVIAALVLGAADTDAVRQVAGLDARAAGKALQRLLDAEVIATDKERGSELQLREPPVRARIRAVLPLGDEVRVRVESADPVERRVTLVPL